MRHSNLWRVAAVALGLSVMGAFAPAVASAPVRTAAIQQSAQVRDVQYLYTGAAAQTDATLTAACAFVVENLHIGVGYSTAFCRIHDVTSGQSWYLPTVTSTWPAVEATATWATTPAGVIQVPPGEGEPPLDTTADYELCIQVETGWNTDRERGPEVCSPIQ